MSKTPEVYFSFRIFLICSDMLIGNGRPVPPIYMDEQLLQGRLYTPIWSELGSLRFVNIIDILLVSLNATSLV